MTAAEFKAWFIGGQFDDVEDTTVEAWIARATPYFNVTRWGGYYTEGLANWVAHNLVESTATARKSIQQTDANDTIHKQIGPISIGKDSGLLNAQAKDPFMRTTYGQRYRYLAGRVGMGGMVA